MKLTIKDLLPFCATSKLVKEDPVKKPLNGVFHSEGWVVSSNAVILVAVKAPYPPENEGKIINKKGEVIEAKYPNWKSVIPHDLNSLLKVPIDYPLLNEWCGDKLKEWERTHTTAPLLIKIGPHSFKVSEIKILLKILKKLKPKEFYVNTTSQYARPIYFKTENKETKAHVLLMPMFEPEYPEEGQILIYPENNKKL